MRAAQRSTFVGADERAFDIGWIGDHRVEDRVGAGVGKPAFGGVGAAQSQCVTRSQSGIGDQRR